MIEVFTAKRIITMNPSHPSAEAVAVRDGRIIECGSLETLEPWLSHHEHVINTEFSQCVFMPGFIDPHLHPTMAAVLLPMEFITAMPWRLPWQSVPATTSHDAFLTRVRELHDSRADEREPLIVWGYHGFWHGQLDRALLNGISTTRPIVVWHRSFHELLMNDGALAWLEINTQEVAQRPQIDIDRGRFYENGLNYAIDKLNPFLLEKERYELGLRRLRECVHFGGHTTIADMAVGMFDLEAELDAMRRILDNDNTPFRVELVPDVLRLRTPERDADQTVDFIDALPTQNTHRLRFTKRVKFFADGAFFSQLAQLDEPGYIDGHAGEWIVAPEQLESEIRRYWLAGYRIHVHTTGDLGVELTLDILEKLQFERPRFNHGFTFEHFGFSTPEQIERIANLGASVSANVYYLFELSQIYARQGIGHERATQMARVGACARAGVRTTLHSDFTMAPALPLNHAWIACNRINSAGDVVAPEERLTLEQALRAITIDAAHVLGCESEIGSIRAGKRADFTVLVADPYEVGVEHLKDIGIVATVFEGRVFELPTQNR